MRKLLIIIVAAAAAFVGTPAAAQDHRRQEARTSCTDQTPCGERRRAFQWFHLGQDEGQRPGRRAVRRLALDN